VRLRGKKRCVAQIHVEKFGVIIVWASVATRPLAA
jgi:hypothetical protein